MRCPKCFSTDDKVIETRASKEGDTIRRRRQCLQCGCRFTTFESILPADIYVVKKDGRREDFNPDKLRNGIRQACWKLPISPNQIDQIVSDITSQLAHLSSSEVDSQYVGELVMEALKKINQVAFVRFASIYRRFTDADAFINEIQNLNTTSTEEKAQEEKPQEQNQ